MYAKVFSSLWQGSLYGQRDPQLVFIYLLAHADADGHVRAVPQAIAGATGMTVGEAEAAILQLEAPDPDSNTPDDEGRRLEPLSKGRWFIVNYLKYRDIGSVEDRKRQNREAKRRQRQSATVSNGQRPSAMSAQGEVEVEVEGEGEGKKSKPLVAARPEAAGFAEWYESMPRKKARRLAERAYRAAVARGRTREQLQAGALRYAAEVAGRDPEKVLHPASWLNGDCVLDEPEIQVLPSESIQERIRRRMEEMGNAQS